MRWAMVLALLLVLGGAGCNGDGNDDADDDDDTGPDDDDDVVDDDDSADDDDTTPADELGDPLTPLDTLEQQPGAHYAQAVLQGDHALVCTARQGLISVDISDPEDLQVASAVSSRCSYLAIEEATGKLYFTEDANETNPEPIIGVVNASDPASIQLAQRHTQEVEVAGLAVASGHLYVAAKADGILVFEIGDGADLTEVARLALDEAWAVRADGDRLVVANGSSGVAVVDISAPASPSPTGSLALDGIARDVAVEGDRVYVALGDSGIAAVHIGDPAAPALLDQADTAGSAVAIASSASVGGLYVADWTDIRLFDISDPDVLRPLGREPMLADEGPEMFTMAIAARDDLVLSSNWDQLTSYRFHPGVSGPDLVVSPLAVNLPDTEAGQTSSASVTLSNVGPWELTVDGVTADPELELLGLPQTLEPGATATCTVEFTASDVQPYQGTVNVLSDDVDQPELPFTASANREGIGIGEMVPDQAWLDLDGLTVNLYDYTGDVILLAYFATF